MKREIKIRKIEKNIEKKIVIASITNSRFLREVGQIYKPAYVSIPYIKLIMKWCKQYYKKYEKAPKKHIQDIFNRHVKKKEVNEEWIELMETFLFNLSKKYEKHSKFNVEYRLDQAEEYFGEQPN